MLAFNASHFRDNKRYEEWQKYSLIFLNTVAKVPLHQWQFAARLLLMIALSIILARLFWLVVPVPVVPAAVVSIALQKSINEESSGINTVVNIDQLKRLPIFGKTDVTAPEVPLVVDSSASETQLKLSLVGVVTSSNNTLARAIVSSGGQQELYAVGAALPVGNNVLLASVMPDRIIINNNGQFEALFLYQNNLTTRPIVANNSAPVTPQMREWLADHAEPEGEPPRTEAAQAQEIRAQQAQYKNEVAAKPAAYRHTGPVTPEMAQWLKDHAEPDENGQEN